MRGNTDATSEKLRGIQVQVVRPRRRAEAQGQCMRAARTPTWHPEGPGFQGNRTARTVVEHIFFRNFLGMAPSAPRMPAERFRPSTNTTPP